MAKIRFFSSEGAPTLAQIAQWTGAELAPGADGARIVANVAPLDGAGAGDLTFLDNEDDAALLEATRASAAFVGDDHAARAPASCAVLLTANPLAAMAAALARLYPSATRAASTYASAGVSERASIHPEALLESGVVVDPGAVIGPGARIGSGAVIGANAVIGPNVCIGRQGSVGPGATVVCALIGDRVVIQAGARIGQDGFAFVAGARGPAKIAHIGRVIIQDDVEIGANSTVERGVERDTLIGEGAKIDAHVRIAANAAIERRCLVARI